ncbi:putative short-chain dehydrogenases/reductase [Panaeolus papilionaceus]|nr:putative short-chain dehydrogenases/reductase [Panaeolus papilionaceus]
MPVSYLITGASRGIGLAIVEELLSQPNTLVIATARNINSSAGLKQLTTRYDSNRLQLVPLDVSKQDSINAAVEETARIVGDNGLDHLILNAGTNHQPLATFDNMDFEMLADELKFNVEYPIRTIRSFLPLLRKGTEKTLTIMTSELGSIEAAGKRTGLANAYSISKAALNMMGRKYGGLLKYDGISTIMLHPGWVKTDIGDTIDEWMSKNAPGVRQMTTEESAAGCVRVIQGKKTEEATIFRDDKGTVRAW